MNPRHKILIVDDRKENLFALQNVLRELNAEVIQSLDGNTALAITLSHEFALAILDVQMPEMDGYELASLLREDPKTRHIPIIFLTAAHRDEQHQFAGYEAGAVDYIVKPYNPKVLLSKVRVFLELADYKHNLETIIEQRTARVSHLNELLRASREINKLLTNDSNSQRVIQQTCKTLQTTRHYQHVWIALFNHELQLDSLSQAGLPQSREPLTRFLQDPRATSFIREVASCPNHSQGVRFPKELLQDVTHFDASHACTSLPLAHNGLFFGILSIGTTDHFQLNAEEQDLLCDVANELSISLFSRAMEKKQRDTEDFYRVAMKATNAGLWDWKVPTGEATFDDRWAEMAGYKLHELQPTSIQTWFQLCHPDDLPSCRQALQDHFEGLTDIYECELRMRHKSNRWIWIRDRGMVVEWDKDQKPLRMAGTHTDITNQKNLEEDLRQAQKMDSIGHLAGGIAHDFNNLLTVINGYSEVLCLDTDLLQDTRDKINHIFEAGKRAQSLTNQLLMFSRKQEIRPRCLDLNQTIESSIKLYRRIISQTIAIQFTAANLPAYISADPHQLDQILANLLINARDAILTKSKGQKEIGGKISIQIQHRTISNPHEAARKGITTGNWVSWSVQDTGTGMTKEIARQIFEPFFSTKPEGQGTGLGLATVYGIVRQNKGNILVTSEENVGTTFEIFWPLLSEDSTEIRQLHDQNPPRKGSETILFVEDDQRVLRVASTQLQDLGYQVQSAPNGHQALKLIREQSYQPSLLITDLVMPGINGIELATELKSYLPNLQTIFISGYSAEDLSSFGISTPNHFIQKPFTITELTRLIGSIFKA